MEESPHIFVRFVMAHFGFGPPLRLEITRLQTLAQQRQIDWSVYIEGAAKLVTDDSVYRQIMQHYRMQAVGWGLTILAALLG